MEISVEAMKQGRETPGMNSCTPALSKKIRTYLAISKMWNYVCG